MRGVEVADVDAGGMGRAGDRGRRVGLERAV